MVDRFPTGIRVRTTAIATVVAGLALVVGGVVLLLVLESNLRNNLETTVETQAQDRAQLLDAGAQPVSLVVTRQEESIVSIVAPDGRVVAAGGTYVLAAPLSDLSPGGARSATAELQELGEGEGGERERTQITYAVAAAGDGNVVVVGAELEVVDRTVAEVRNLLLVGLPFLVLAVGAITWVATGRTLRPVDEIRSTAAEIGSGPIEERIPVPASNDEVARLATTMNLMLDRIDAGQRSQRQFTSDASHELKSPVANLRALAETTQLDDPDWPEARNHLVAEADRLAAIVDDLLFMSITDEQASVGSNAVVHVDDMLFDEARLVASTTSLRVDIEGVGPCDVMGSVDELSRLVRNLVSNATRHAAKTVALTASVEEGTAIIVVSDDGPGVPAEEREAIFGRFTRSQTARDRSSGGTGLGLAIVQSIADRHGGEVQVSEAAIGGARFEVRLSAAAGD